MAIRTKELPPEKLSYFCDPSQFKFKSTAELELLDDIDLNKKYTDFYKTS